MWHRATAGVTALSTPLPALRGRLNPSWECGNSPSKPQHLPGPLLGEAERPLGLPESSSVTP